MGSLAPPGEVYGPPVPQYDRPPCMWKDFLSQVTSQPDALAIACVHQSPDLFGVPNLPLDDDAFRANPYLRWSFSSLRHGIERLVKSLRPLGVKESTPIVTFSQNSAEFVLTAYVSIKLGCITIPINPRNLTNEEEVRHMVKTALSVCNGERPVVLAGDEHLAFQIDELGLFPDAVKIILGANMYSDWTTFQSLMDQTAHDVNVDADEALNPSVLEKGASVLFTSGTTSLPKGIYRANSVWAQAYFVRALMDGHMDVGDRIICNLPNNHAMGFISLTNALAVGTGIVYPGSAFDPELMLETLYTEKITHTFMVPTMIHALVAVKTAKYPDRPLTYLKNSAFGGATMTVETLNLVTKELGAKGAENLFGCTEGVLTSSGSMSDFSKIVDGLDVSVGWPLAGYGMRIIDPETGEMVPRGGLGEIHGCGPSVDGPYIGGVGADNWYESDGRLWYKTGDAGRIDDRGCVFVTGRYKDMIIRGGENISPSAMEAILSKNATLNALVPLIVGAPDEIAGEVPVCVVKGQVTPEIRELIQSEIIHHMGTLYVPEDVISSQDLGLEDYPRTTSGKIQKTKIAAMVKKHLAKGPEVNSTNGHLTEEIRTIWAKAVGLEPSRIRLDAPIGEFADSITVMRVRDRIKRTTGKALALADMMGVGTIEQQIKILQSMGAGQDQEVQVKRPTRQGQPGMEDMAHLTENPNLFEPTKELVNKTLSGYGLGWDDVEDVMPAYDFGAIMSQTKLYDSWNFNMAINPSQKVNKTQLRRAFEAVVINNRILASFLVWDFQALQSDDALHVVVKQTSKFFDMIVEDGGSLDTIEDLKNISLHHPHPDYATLPGPVYRTLLFDVKETGSAAMVTSVHHCVIDASMAQIVQEDMDRALAGVYAGAGTTEELLTKLIPHVDYKPWADSYFNLRHSVEARAATKWHLKRLSSLPQHIEAGALFPPTVRTPRDKYNAALVEGEDCIPFIFDVPDIHALRKEHPSITAQAVVKSAVALMNVHRTGHTHALFTNHEASRTYFPFISKAMMDLAPKQYEATDVSGPAYQNVTNLVEIREDETVLAFLGRIQDEQTLLTKHAAAPLREIMRGLIDGEELVPEVIGAQVYNWVPGLGTTGTNPYHHHELLNAVVRPHLGLSLNCGLGGPQNQTVIIQVRGDGFDLDGLRKVGEELETITKWLVSKEQWESVVGGYKTVLA
ncbi:Acyl-CoA synthetase family member 2, mitochondrial [Cytospora mali]|uniref:Acyl-CoA synthetase family member 2, mitochondrial n=1 Tax=Cytospora mali TaxID=578113 RepID=A0A194VK10_CYTMA|nr:Acyl-CoA synthetase family member 2, mitochondrial [Valsa mali]